MSEQGLLFEKKPSPWVDRLWSRIDRRERRKVITILARMALESLPTREDAPEPKKSRPKEGTHES